MSYNDELQSNNDALRSILDDVNALPDYSLESRLSLGFHTDGLIYIFVDGKPVGVGIELPKGGISGYVDSANNIVINDLPDGTYSVKYEMADGTTVEIGDLVLDSTVYYSVTNALTNCTNSNGATQAAAGGSYSATISANSGYELESVVVTMGGQSVSVSGGMINIASVTGNIVITAVAEEKAVEPTYTNLLPLSVDANGNDYVGTNGEDGYKSGYKMSTSSGSESATTGAYCSGFMPITDIYSYIRVKNITLSDAANVNNFVFYDANKTKLTGSSANGTAGAFHVNVADEGNGVYKISPSLFVSGSIAFFRFSCGGITDDTIVTVNEEITTPEIIEPTNLADPASSDWQEGYRLSIGSGDTSALAGHTTTNYIPAKMGDILRVKGLKIVGYLAGTTSDSPNAAKIVTFDASKTKLGGLYGTGSTGKNNYGNKVTQNGDISTYTIMMANDDSQQTTSNCAFIRIDGELTDGYTKNDVIITINEPIE